MDGQIRVKIASTDKYFNLIKTEYNKYPFDESIMQGVLSICDPIAGTPIIEIACLDDGSKEVSCSINADYLTLNSSSDGVNIPFLNVNSYAQISNCNLFDETVLHGDITDKSGNKVSTIVGSYTDDTFCKVTKLNAFVSSDNAIISGDKGSYIWSISSFSDARLKKNVSDSKIKALDKLDMVKYREFDFIDKKFGTHQDLGYVADELKEVFPDCVVSVPQDKEQFGYEELYQVDDVKMIKYLGKAIQELHGIVKEQSEEINRLKQQIGGNP